MRKDQIVIARARIMKLSATFNNISVISSHSLCFSVQVIVCPFAHFLLAIAIYVRLRFTASGYPLWYFQTFLIYSWARIMKLSATFNNISVISSHSVLLMEESVVLGENHWPAASHWQLDHIMLYRVHLAHSWLITGFVTIVTRRLRLVEQEQHTFP
jgi:hypothetical protein